MSQRTIEYKEGGVLMNLNKKRRVDIFENTMAHMTYVEIEQAAKEGEIVLFPIAVIEEHGPHLPLAVDVYGAYLQSRRVKAELKKKKIKSLIAPPFYWGVNTSTGSFGGSFTCREETVVSVLWDAMSSLKRWGFHRIFIINHHMDGSHMKAIDKAIRKVRKEMDIEVFWLMDQFFARRLGFNRDEAHLLFHKSLMPYEPLPLYPDIHAETYETSFMWYYFPRLVNLEIWETLRPTHLTFEDLHVWRRGGMDARKLTPQGYFGDPTRANPENGKKKIETYGRTVADVIEAFLQGRYSPPDR
jgi:creatinine amidohydrolase